MSDLNLTPLSQVDTSKQYMNLQGLHDLRAKAREDERAALRPVAEQFEALFLQQVLKEARKVSFDEGFLDGKDADFFKDWHDKQLSQDLSAKGSLGFADKIVEQLAPQLDRRVQTIEEAQRVLSQKPQNASSMALDLPLTTSQALQSRPLVK